MGWELGREYPEGDAVGSLGGNIILKQKEL